MRKLTPVLFVAMLIVAPAADAQLGVKAGFSFASTTESEFVPDVETRTGFAAGLSLGIPLGTVLTFRPEAMFVQKGGKYATNQTLEINELNIPLLLGIDIPITGVAPYLFAGPVAEYELSCKAADVDCIDTNSMRWGFTGGVGLRLGGALTVEGRYGYTLSEISDDVQSKPRTIMLLAGLQLGGR